MWTLAAMADVIQGREADQIESEKMNFHRRVYSGYLELSRQDPLRIKRINVSGPQSLAEIQGYVDEFLEKAKG